MANVRSPVIAQNKAGPRAPRPIYYGDFRALGPNISVTGRSGGPRPGPILYYYLAPFRYVARASGHPGAAHDHGGGPGAAKSVKNLKLLTFQWSFAKLLETMPPSANVCSATLMRHEPLTSDGR